MKARFHRSSCSVVAGKALAAAAFALAVGWGARGEASGSVAYAQGGLVLHLDGIDNKLSNGVRSHDDAPTKWHDLSGQGNNVAIPASGLVKVEPNAMFSDVRNNNSDKTEVVDYTVLTNLTGLVRGTNDPAYTVEVVMQRGDWCQNPNEHNLQNVVSTPRGAFGYRRLASNGFYFFGPETKSQLHLMNWQPTGIKATDIHTSTVVYGWDKASTVMRLDGKTYAVDFNDGYTSAWSSRFNFFSNPRAAIRVFAIRVYSRALTQEEVEWNLALDQMRFCGKTGLFVVKALGEATFDGTTPCAPEPVVMNPATGKPLTKGVDYQVAYGGNDRIGEASVTVTGLGAFAGCAVTKPFKVVLGDCFRALSYIDATGTQAVNTEYYPNPTTRMEAELMFMGATGARTRANLKTGTSLFGCAERDDDCCFSCNFGGSANQDNDLFFWLDKGYKNGQGVPVKKIEGITTRTVRSKMTVDAATGKVFYGTDTASKTLIASVKTTTHSVNPLYLFGTADKNGVVTPLTIFTMRVFGWKIWDGQALRRDFVPCYRMLDRSYGFLDKVSGRFFKSVGTDSFAGDLSSHKAGLPTGYRQLDYLFATGTQHVPTGVTAGPDTILLADFTPFDVRQQQRVFGARTAGDDALTANDLFFEAYVNGSNKWACCCCDGPSAKGDAVGMWSASTVTPANGTRVSLLLDAPGGGFFVNGNRAVTVTRARTKTSPREIDLLRGGPVADRPRGVGHLFGACIWSAGTLVRDFVPCYREADGVAGLYDLVGQAFHPADGDAPMNHGTGGKQGVALALGTVQSCGFNPGVQFTDLTNFSFSVWVRNPRQGNYGSGDETYGAIVSQGALGDRLPGFCCFVSYNRTTALHTLTVQTRTSDNKTMALRYPMGKMTSDDKWHFVACTHDLGAHEARLYVDGKAVVVETDPAKFVNPKVNGTNLQVTLGNRSGDYPYRGELAQVTLWNRALSADEVARLRLAPATGKEPGLLGYWPLDCGSDGIWDKVANGATPHNLAPKGAVGFTPDAVRWFVPGTRLILK